MSDHETKPLAPDQTIEHRLPGGKTESYRLDLDQGDFVSVGVEQKGLDVVVRLFGPSGDKLTEVDSPNGNTGFERVTEIAGAAGAYRVDVEASDGAEETATYAITLEARRPATDDDRRRVAADRVFAQGEDLRRAHKWSDALKEYRQALDGYRAIGYPQGVADGQYRAGWMEDELEKYPEAIDFYQQALAGYDELGQERLQALLSNRLGRVQLLVGQLAEAAVNQGRALALYGTLGNRKGEADAANNLGNVYKSTGRTEKALSAYERALALWKELGSSDQMIAQLNIGDVYLLNDDSELAMAAFERALEQARSAESLDGEATSLLKIGEALIRLERFDEARDRLTAALSMRRRREDHRGEAVVLGSLGSLFLKAGELGDARQTLDQALRLYVEVDDPVGEAIIHQKLGRLYHRLGDPAAARREHELALPLFEKANDRQGVASSHYGIARALYETKDYEGARRVLKEVLSSTETLRSESESLELRSSYFASRRHYWDLYISSLMRLDEQSPGAGFDQLALQATEQWRARGLLDLLAEAGVQIREGAPQELLDRERKLSADLDALARESLQGTGESGNGAVSGNLSNRENELLLELDRTRAQIRSQSSRLSDLADPDPLDLGEVQRKLLDSDTLLLAYFLGDERSFVWDVSRDKVASHVLPPRSEIEEAAKTYYELLSRLSTRAAAHREEVGTRLSEMLLGPVADDLGGKRLVVVADGALHYLPFTTLPTPRKVARDDGELLIDRHEVVHLPSASVLASLRRGERTQKRASKTIAIVADPVFNRDDPRIAQAAGTTGEEARSDGAGAVDGDLAQALRDAGSGPLQRLPHSAEEAHAILALTKPDSTFAAFGFDASYPLLESGVLADYRTLHFATHGLIDRQHPELSGLALSLFDRQGKPQRGFLRLHDIYGLRLGAELVVLSACETGLGEELAGEGLVGLTRGFLYAGAPRVVQSLWKVGDESTAELMKRFYTHLLKNNEPPATALRLAQISMRQDERWSAPFHWAAFEFQGDWQPTERPLGDDDIEEEDTGGASAGDGVRTDTDLPGGPPDPLRGATPPPPPFGARRGGSR